MGARKLPAAPALRDSLINGEFSWFGFWGDIHYIVNPSKLVHALLHGLLQTLHIPDINRSKPQHFRSFPSRSYIPSHAFRFLDIASHDAGVGAEVDEGSNLRTADGACAACAEDYFVFWKERMSLEGLWRWKR